ncbi:MAG TPA: hypothetical protein VEL31_14030, partial [Ktedonobacteraceae bacterium]|nr:hypothetical protein [Ktedonobacteraceae bacterium]
RIARKWTLQESILQANTVWLFLLPTMFFQVPGAIAPFFSPIGFLWCSQTSYFPTFFLAPVDIRSSEANLCES